MGQEGARWQLLLLARLPRLACVHRFGGGCLINVHSGTWPVPNTCLLACLLQVSGKTVGVVGTGKIGVEFCTLLKVSQGGRLTGM